MLASLVLSGGVAFVTSVESTLSWFTRNVSCCSSFCWNWVKFAGEVDVDAPADMANMKLPEAMTAPARPSRIGWILMILLLGSYD